MARATSSLPVPLGPSAITGSRVGATRRMSARSATIGGECPIRPMSSLASSRARKAASSCASLARSTARATTTLSMSGSTGLARKSHAPASIARIAKA
jgi:hypothetical protein